MSPEVSLCHCSAIARSPLLSALLRNAGNSPIRFRRVSDYDPFLTKDSFVAQITVGPLRIGDDVITKDSLFVIIVEIDTRIYKTYPKLDYTIVHPKYPRDSLSSIYIMQ